MARSRQRSDGFTVPLSPLNQSKTVEGGIHIVSILISFSNEDWLWTPVVPVKSTSVTWEGQSQHGHPEHNTDGGSHNDKVGTVIFENCALIWDQDYRLTPCEPVRRFSVKYCNTQCFFPVSSLCCSGGYLSLWTTVIVILFSRKYVHGVTLSCASAQVVTGRKFRHSASTSSRNLSDMLPFLPTSWRTLWVPIFRCCFAICGSPVLVFVYCMILRTIVLGNFFTTSLDFETSFCWVFVHRSPTPSKLANWPIYTKNWDWFILMGVLTHEYSHEVNLWWSHEHALVYGMHQCVQDDGLTLIVWHQYDTICMCFFPLKCVQDDGWYW